MVETIAPVVHGGRRGSYYTSVGLHAAGAALAAAVVGALLGAAGALLGAPWGRIGLAVVVAVSLLYAARELLALDIPLPGRKAQVPDWWRTFYSPATAAVLYGLGLGAGFLTYPTYGTFGAVAALAFASGNPLLGLLLCVPFGLVRGLSVLVSRSGADTGLLVERLNELATTPFPAVVNGAALVALAVAGALALAA